MVLFWLVCLFSASHGRFLCPIPSRERAGFCFAVHCWALCSDAHRGNGPLCSEAWILIPEEEPALEGGCKSKARNRKYLGKGISHVVLRWNSKGTRTGQCAGALAEVL